MQPNYCLTNPAMTLSRYARRPWSGVVCRKYRAAAIRNADAPVATIALLCQIQCFRLRLWSSILKA